MWPKGIRNHSGSALLPVMLLSAVFLLLAVIMLKMVYNTYVISRAFEKREKAFWLAEAGLEQGKSQIAIYPDWYTDLPHLPADDRGWLKSGAVGETTALGNGMFKLVREKGKNQLWAVGIRGEAVVFLKIDFDPLPFRPVAWEQI